MGCGKNVGLLINIIVEIVGCYMYMKLIGQIFWMYDSFGLRNVNKYVYMFKINLYYDRQVVNFIN